jgi:hypothetical protein
MTFAPNLVIPQILYANKLRTTGAFFQYQGATEDPKFPLVNAVDWKDWTLFRVLEGTTDVAFSLPVGYDINCFCWFCKALGSTDTGFSIRLYKQTSPGVFAPVMPAIDPLTAPIGMQTFATESMPSNYLMLVRFVVPAGKSLYVRQLGLGEYMTPETGQNVGVAPPSLQQQWKTTNALSVNGSLVGRNLIRLVKDYEINIEYLSPSFVQNQWAPFCTHALRYPFFFRWNPASYPTDCMFASAKTVESPTISKPGRLTAKMPLIGITE